VLVLTFVSLPGHERTGAMTDEIELGPVDYFVVEFPGNKMTGEGLPLLVDLVDRGIVRLLDLAFIRKDADGTVTAFEIADLDNDGQLDLAVFQGASSGLLGQDDLAEAAALIEPGNSAGIVVFENRWAAPFVGALRRGGAQLVASGRIPVEDLLAALDEAEAVH
jgi:hypothetical protein